jgi:hypothetical protein
MKRNRHNYLLAVLGAGLLGLSGIASAAVAPILGSKHDFSSGGGGDNATSAAAGEGTTDTCVFCHTPHAAAGGQVPLWNKLLPTAGYTPYGSSTLDAAPITSAAILGGPSLACLSCHDGTQAVDNVINAAGSGGLTAGVSAGYTFTGTAIGGGNLLVGTAGTGGVAVLSNNLADDHPISVQYAGGGYTTIADVAGNDPDFNPAENNGALAAADIRWWVDTDGGTTKEKTDMILYTRTISTAAGVPEPFVECATCHDPHNGAGQDGVSDSQMFLRIANTSSAVCVACHTK